MNSFKEIEVCEKIMAAMFNGLGATKFATVLNNTFSHGQIIEDVYGFCDQKVLDSVFAGIKKFAKVGKELDGK